MVLLQSQVSYRLAYLAVDHASGDLLEPYHVQIEQLTRRRKQNGSSPDSTASRCTKGLVSTKGWGRHLVFTGTRAEAGVLPIEIEAVYEEELLSSRVLDSIMRL